MNLGVNLGGSLYISFLSQTFLIYTELVKVLWKKFVRKRFGWVTVKSP